MHGEYPRIQDDFERFTLAQKAWDAGKNNYQPPGADEGGPTKRMRGGEPADPPMDTHSPPPIRQYPFPSAGAPYAATKAFKEDVDREGLELEWRKMHSQKLQ